MTTEYINKEISWLSFNDRVLQEAADRNVPLIERIKFLGIFSSNLDEFFRVRVATLKRLAKLGKKSKKLIGHDPNIILKKIQEIVLEHQKKFNDIYQEILKELAEEKIFIIDEKELNPDQCKFIENYFHQEVRPKLIPIMLDQVEQFPDLKDHAIYLVVCMQKNHKSKKTTHALIEVPTNVLPRFILLPQLNENRYIIILDDVIRFGLKDIFSVFHYEVFDAYIVKLTRDAELDIEDDLEESYVRKVVKSLKQREEGNPVRFIYDEQLPKKILNIFVKELQLNEQEVLIPGPRYHNFRDFMNFPDFGFKRFRYQPFGMLAHRDIDRKQSLLKRIEEKDILIHFCYQSFNYIIDLLREASIDPRVTSIKITLYRVGKNSNVINALINAAKNGKKVVVVLELQARFDEEANIYWSNKLRDGGVRVIYGVPGLKVHSKLCLITSLKRGRPFHYAMIGTGNFNEDTAKVYSDHILLTANTKITNEVHRLFEFFVTNYKINNHHHLIVSPFTLRKKFIRLIKKEIENKKAGKNAFIFLKLNNLVDSQIINYLYQASQAGVEIKLIVRGMFSLVPGVQGMSENIEAISIIDKFLEHSRIFVFCNNNNPKYYITSADLMPRNLDSRVEVTCPIYDKDLQHELQTFLDIQWNDNVKARMLSADLNNLYRQTENTQKIRAQWEIYEYLKNLKLKSEAV